MVWKMEKSRKRVGIRNSNHIWKTKTSVIKHVQCSKLDARIICSHYLVCQCNSKCNTWSNKKGIQAFRFIFHYDTCMRVNVYVFYRRFNCAWGGFRLLFFISFEDLENKLFRFYKRGIGNSFSYRLMIAFLWNFSKIYYRDLCIFSIQNRHIHCTF